MSQIMIILPEVLLGSLCLLTILFSSFIKNKKVILNFSLFGLICYCMIIWACNSEIVANNSQELIKNFRINMHALALKQVVATLGSLVLLSFIGTRALYRNNNKLIEINHFSTEYTIFVLLSCIAIFCIISSTNLILLFVSLELQAFCGYILAVINRDNKSASEAAVKYFIIGAITSCVSLFGMSLLYGVAGSVDYWIIADKIRDNASYHGIYLISAVFIMINICFKLANAPLQGAILDVYQGAPLYSLNMIAGLQKVGAIAAFVLIAAMFRDLQNFSCIVEGIAILSLLIGSMGGLRQQSLKRLLGYSAVLNSGFIIIAALNSDFYDSDLIAYMIIYVANIIGILSLLQLITTEQDIQIKNLAGLVRKHKAFGCVLVLLLLSLMGIPPFGGFFIKYYVFKQAIIKSQTLFCIFAVVASCIAGYYYLSVIKTIVLDENSGKIHLVEDKEAVWVFGTVVSVCLIIVVFPLYLYL